MENRTVTDTITVIDSDTDSAAASRRARFGELPERVRFEDMVEEKPATAPDPARDAHDPEASWASFSCLALDLGL
ncbi:hypothetical protein [Streptomyces sp. VMFN-G11Ma]|uniref:hypothetical protein n=1 Tax=Streptomyces sp. VMFN-G11Ma TaxID=2135609 RepID=UPI000D3D312A|nr:hypothetical protein [Streptomyces sp. VMFN-G11Ma]PTM86985.1 hypothetical protein C7821_11618 [Streptomyces sp. VMFN-G11Ma]